MERNNVNDSQDFFGPPVRGADEWIVSDDPEGTATAAYVNSNGAARLCAKGICCVSARGFVAFAEKYMIALSQRRNDAIREAVAQKAARINGKRAFPHKIFGRLPKKPFRPLTAEEVYARLNSARDAEQVSAWRKITEINETELVQARQMLAYAKSQPNGEAWFNYKDLCFIGYPTTLIMLYPEVFPKNSQPASSPELTGNNNIDLMW